MKLVACLCKGHKQEIKEFSAKTKDIKAMVDWLEGNIYKTCCGIDVHKMKLVACLCKGHKQEIKEFSAKTKDIKAMVDWLEGNKCEMVAMESTSVY